MKTESTQLPDLTTLGRYSNRFKKDGEMKKAITEINADILIHKIIHSDNSKKNLLRLKTKDGEVQIKISEKKYMELKKIGIANTVTVFK